MRIDSDIRIAVDEFKKHNPEWGSEAISFAVEKIHNTVKTFFGYIVNLFTFGYYFFQREKMIRFALRDNSAPAPTLSEAMRQYEEMLRKAG